MSESWPDGRGRPPASLAMWTVAKVSTWATTSAPPSRARSWRTAQIAVAITIAAVTGYEPTCVTTRTTSPTISVYSGSRRSNAPSSNGSNASVSSSAPRPKNTYVPTAASASGVASSSASVAWSATKNSGLRTRPYIGLASSFRRTVSRNSSSRRSAADEPDDEPDDHERAERGGAAADVGLDRVERAPEEVAEQAEQRRPQAGAEHVVGEELAQLHAGRAGQERRDRPHEPDEAPDQDRDAAVAVEEVLDVAQPLLGDLEPRAVALEEAAAEPAAEHVGGQVAGDRAPTRARSARRSRSRPGRRRRRRSGSRSRRARRARRTRRSRGTRARRRAGRSTCRGACRCPRSARSGSGARRRRCPRGRGRR